MTQGFGDEALDRVMSSEREAAWESVVLLLVCVIIALAALGIVVWALVNGRLSSLDGLLLATTCLLLILAFGGNVAWALRTGELQLSLKALMKSPHGNTSNDNAPL
jgi:hypothetical protein